MRRGRSNGSHAISCSPQSDETAMRRDLVGPFDSLNRAVAPSFARVQYTRETLARYRDHAIPLLFALPPEKSSGSYKREPIKNDHDFFIPRFSLLCFLLASSIPMCFTRAILYDDVQATSRHDSLTFYHSNAYTTQALVNIFLILLYSRLSSRKLQLPLKL
jgi:hypothetical protein